MVGGAALMCPGDVIQTVSFAQLKGASRAPHDLQSAAALSHLDSMKGVSQPLQSCVLSRV